MNVQVFDEKPSQKNPFWKSATKYAAIAADDEKFVSEIAYMMVTLHRTGS